MKTLTAPVDILIVDDREDGLIALEAVLQPLSGLNIIRARSGVEALDIIAKHDFSVILLDVQMPILDGFQTAHLIRSKYAHCKHTPIIFVTAINKDDEYIYRGYEAGAVDYVFKPFEPQILRSKVSVFVDLYRKSIQIAEQTELLRQNELREKHLRLAELELESLKSYRRLADAVPHIIWKANPDGTLDYFNKVWMDYTGLSHEQSVGHGWQSCIHPDDINPFLKIWIQATTASTSFEFEARIRNDAGEMKWHWIRAVPTIRRNGEPGWIGTCTNIHDRKISEEKLVLAQQEAQSANLAKTNFLANMSHEIRTPMSAILGFAELMHNSNQSEAQRSHCIATIHRNGRQLLNIIDEILDISKVETGNLEIEKIDFDVVNLLSDLKGLLQIQTERKGLALKFDFLNKIPTNVSSDPTRLRQILLNVIGNAIKFTYAGEISVQVDYKAKAKNTGHLEISVRDTGVGIEKSHLHRLFQPFSQEDSSTTRKFGGTGLGLALSRKFAQALGGDVVIEDTQINKGSTFKISILVDVAEKSNWVNGLFEVCRLENSALMVSEKEILKGVNVLLVDDAPDNQTIIGLFLNAAGAHVEYADNGLEGIEKAMKGNYNVVLMDIQMPKLDGYEATQKLRASGYQKPIVALTAHAMKEERDRCLKTGYTEHFIKPVDRSKLISLVRQMANG